MLNEIERERRKNQIGASEIYLLSNFDTKRVTTLFNLKSGREEV